MFDEDFNDILKELLIRLILDSSDIVQLCDHVSQSEAHNILSKLKP